jgi:Glycosyltransferase (GlcNAc)
LFNTTAIGYDYYAPERSVCFHHYAVGKNAAIRNKVHHFWENDNQYAGTGRKAMARLLGIVHMNPEVDPKTWDHTDEDLYGLGRVRTPEQFYKIYGIDVKAKVSEDHLCKFVDSDGKKGPMHTMFTKFLRKDGMGIDYSYIHYRFVDPDKPHAKKETERDEEEEEAEEGGEGGEEEEEGEEEAEEEGGGEEEEGDND